MAKPLLSNELWEPIKQMLPPGTSPPNEPRPQVPDRNALTGILCVKTGVS